MISKKEANYVYPAKKDNCEDCTMFRKSRRCTLVTGVIEPKGHCDHYDEKKYGLPVEK